jgi:hypothetical protein
MALLLSASAFAELNYQATLTTLSFLTSTYHDPTGRVEPIAPSSASILLPITAKADFGLMWNNGTGSQAGAATTGASVVFATWVFCPRCSFSRGSLGYRNPIAVSEMSEPEWDGSSRLPLNTTAAWK